MLMIKDIEYIEVYEVDLGSQISESLCKKTITLKHYKVDLKKYRRVYKNIYIERVKYLKIEG